MTTDLKDKTVAELRDDAIWEWPGTARNAVEELARRLAAAQENLEEERNISKQCAITAEDYRLRLAAAQSQIVAQQVRLQFYMQHLSMTAAWAEDKPVDDELSALAAHDAEERAKALEEVEEKFGLLGLNFIFNRAFVKEYLLSRAAEYRAKAKGDKP